MPCFPHPTKLVLTLHSASLLPGPAMRNVHAVVTSGDKTYQSNSFHPKTTSPIWEQAAFAFNVRAKTHLCIHVRVVGTKNLRKRGLGHFYLNFSNRRLSKQGTLALTCPLVGGCGGIVNMSIQILYEAHPIRDWAIREVTKDISTRRPCHSLLQCVAKGSIREDIFKNACGACFLALVMAHNERDDSFTAKELVRPASPCDPSPMSTLASDSTEDDNPHQRPSPRSTGSSSSPLIDDSSDSPSCPTIQAWMQAVYPQVNSASSDQYNNLVTSFSMCCQLVRQQLPVLVVVLQLCLLVNLVQFNRICQ
ncbi:hypothetical protein AaE_011342 [Aphanomyces astaci]|uniref:C2 domain-containing protein n=1 Tax=Aphanomyces astaci TaxID=112090 RepID=A0A6A4ZQK5_APHAT|nr:hypothetical protein AaE_011342 [Aphanomyces astaci]